MVEGRVFTENAESLGQLLFQEFVCREKSRGWREFRQLRIGQYPGTKAIPTSRGTARADHSHTAIDALESSGRPESLRGLLPCFDGVYGKEDKVDREARDGAGLRICSHFVSADLRKELVR